MRVQDLLDQVSCKFDINFIRTASPCVSYMEDNRAINIVQHEAANTSPVYEVRISENTKIITRIKNLIAPNIAEPCNYGVILKGNVHIGFNLIDVISNSSFESSLDKEEALVEIFDSVLGKSIYEAEKSKIRHYSNYSEIKYVRMMTKNLIRSQSQSVEQINSLLNSYESARLRLSSISSKLQAERDKMSAFSQRIPRTRKESQEEFLRFKKMEGGLYEGFLLDEGGSICVITNPISIFHEENVYSFGQFSVKMNFSQTSVSILKFKDNVLARGHYHPHVGTGGAPCYGNISVQIAQSMRDWKLCETYVLINNLLTSYGRENPYVRIEEFKASSVSNGEFDECIRSADPFWDCINCDQSECPSHESRHERCWSQIEAIEKYTDCVSCGICRFSLEASDRC